MRVNKFLAQATGISRRAADAAIAAGRVTINGTVPSPGYDVADQDDILYDGRHLKLQDVTTTRHTTIILNKPVGYVVSRDGQGSQTVYDLLPAHLHNLKPVGRLDKDSSGLLLMTNDGELANQLTHPRYSKSKIYQVILDKPLQPLHRQMISDHGLQLEDGPSQLQLERLHDDNDSQWQVTMREGRNRQIRRTFSALGYTVTGLHRIAFGSYALNNLPPGSYSE
jgi:23S rRNA pseudouridine2605 synthase